MQKEIHRIDERIKLAKKNAKSKDEKKGRKPE